MVSNSNRRGSVASVPDPRIDEKKPSDIRSGSVTEHERSSEDRPLVIRPMSRLIIENGRVKVIPHGKKTEDNKLKYA